MYKDPVRMEIANKIIPDKGKKHFYSFNDGVERIRQVDLVYNNLEKSLNDERLDI